MHGLQYIGVVDRLATNYTINFVTVIKPYLFEYNSMISQTDIPS